MQVSKTTFNILNISLYSADTSYAWPEGVYGILSRNPCPANWFDFTTCMDTENIPNVVSSLPTSKLDLGPCDERNTSITFRYCFKGPNVPSRPGGFWTKSNAFITAFVIQNVNVDCSMFGNDGGQIYMDTEDETAGAMRYGTDGINGAYHPDYYPQSFPLGNINYCLKFCSIGQYNISSNNDRIRIGEFNQMFGLFSYPDKSPCPVLDSPYGVLYATKEVIFIDLENNNPSTRVDTGTPPFILNKNNDATVGVCVYDP